MVEIDSADLQLFILELHDETRWEAKYYKAVIRYAIAHAENPELEPPIDIHYTRNMRYHSSVTK